MNRREFLTSAATLSAGLILPGTPAFAGMPNEKWRELMAGRPRSLNLVRDGEKFKGEYWHPNTGIHMDNYVEVCWLMRDKKANRVCQISTGVLEVLFCIQTWLRTYGIDLPIHIISGYRSYLTNMSIEGAAKASLHMHGRAADFWIPGISTDVLAMMALAFEAGGVGFYPKKKTIHIDDGNVRFWRK